MSATVRHLPFLVAVALVFASWGSLTATGQESSQPTLSLPGQLGEFPSFGASDGEPATFTAEYVLKTGTREGALKVKATINPAWHVYSITQPEGGPLPTKITVKSTEVEVLGPYSANPAPEVHHYKDIWGDLPNEEHFGLVIWTAPIRLKEGIDPESFQISVNVDGQACTNDLGKCVPVGGDLIASFAGYSDEVPAANVARSAPLEPSGPPPESAPTEISPTPSTGTDSAKATTAKADAPAPASIGGAALATYIAFGLLGGLLLNLMPCVLPVIGLKVLALAEQAHMHRAEVLKLNLWFTAGIISVFMVLATLAAAFAMNWGEQFTSTAFKMSITAVVFAMALSFLSVWEIPIPGFVGRGVSNDLQQKEGALGAFFKGVFTTILSTPCSGPALGAVFAVIVGQPPYIPYLLFFSIGFGMALPYLVIGLFPGLLKFLPKPGEWMETFKQVMGFILLLTVAYLLSTLNESYFVSAFTLLVGVWFACWMIGRIKITAPTAAKARTWVTATAVIAATALMVTSDTFLVIVRPPLSVASAATEENSESLIKWQPYSPEALEEALASGKTVMVEFTAQWCLTCKVNLLRAIDTDEVKKMIDQNEVVPLLADWTDKNDEIKQALAQLNSKSIPLLAIYPAGKKEDVIVLRDLISKSQLVAALEKAGPSNDAGATAATAMITDGNTASANN